MVNFEISHFSQSNQNTGHKLQPLDTFKGKDSVFNQREMGVVKSR